MALYDDDAALDEVADTADVAVTCDPPVEVGDVVVVPLLLVAEVDEAACNACNNGSVFDPSVLLASLLSPEPPI